MIKIAFFVEGLTEQTFIEKLLFEILGTENLTIEKKKITGGSRVPISIVQIGSPSLTQNAKYYFIIYDCAGDSRIPSLIKQRRSFLIRNRKTKGVIVT